MGKVPDHFYQQSGLIPLRVRDGEVEILLVTSSSGKRWIIPKGVVELDLSPADSAVKEAYEEAGVTGTVVAEAVGEYSYEKWGGVCTVTVFAYLVEKELKHWPEEGMRDRKWFTPAKAAKELAKDMELVHLLPDAVDLAKEMGQKSQSGPNDQESPATSS